MHKAAYSCCCLFHYSRALLNRHILKFFHKVQYKGVWPDFFYCKKLWYIYIQVYMSIVYEWILHGLQYTYDKKMIWNCYVKRKLNTRIVCVCVCVYRKLFSHWSYQDEEENPFNYSIIHLSLGKSTSKCVTYSPMYDLNLFLFSSHRNRRCL